MRLPPKAARIEGPPEGADAPMNQSREAHHTAQPHHTPQGGHVDGYPTIFHPSWRCTVSKRDVLSDRYAAERATMGTAPEARKRWSGWYEGS